MELFKTLTEKIKYMKIFNVDIPILPNLSIQKQLYFKQLSLA